MPSTPRSRRCAVLFVLLCRIALLPVCAAESGTGSRGSDANHRAVRIFSQIALAPDGKRLAWVENGEIRVAPLNRLDTSLRVTAASSPDGSCAESAPVWSPDSAALAFLSDCADLGDQTDLYLSHLDGRPPVRLTALNGYLQSPAFSPDGKRIGFLYVANATRPAGALAAMDAPSGVIGEEHVEVQRIAAVSVSAAKPTASAFLTPASLHVYEFDWSPDSRSLAYIAAPPPGENNWWVAKLYAQPLRRKALPAAILDPAHVSGPLHGLQIAMPRWSPNGQTIAFLGGLMSDQGVLGGDVWSVAASGGQPRNLTPNRRATAQWIAWDGNRQIVAREIAAGVSRLVRLGVENSPHAAAGESTTIFSYPGSVGIGAGDRGLAVSADRSLFVFAASTFNRPPAIFAAGPGAVALAPIGANGLVQLTHDNDGIQPEWGRAESLTWTDGGFPVQGWLLLPAHYDPARKYPLLVEVHGGPAADVDSRWNGGAGGFSAAVFSSLGYFVLLPNPRGSFGQGEAFTQANRKDFGYGDLRDILAGVDAVLAKYPVDPHRIGIAGWSYGGFMAMFAVTQTHRFRAAVAGAGISDWLSYYGENSIDQWMIPYFGASVYDAPQRYARSSAINFVKDVSAPTLLVVGDRDGECPAPQSFEFWHALRDLHVPTRLVVYPNEGHGFTDPAHRFDVEQRAIDWFARFMPPTP